MIDPRTRLYMLLLGLVVLFFVINLVRTRKLKEEFAILWLLGGFSLLAVSVFVDVVDHVSYALGIEYPPALLFLIALLGMTFILFQFSVSISRYSEQIKVLTQEIAILRHRVAELEGGRTPEKPSSPTDLHG